MAKCSQIIKRWDREEQCTNDAVIRYDGLNRCAEHADPNVLAAYHCIKVIAQNFGSSSKVAQCAAALEPRDE